MAISSNSPTALVIGSEGGIGRACCAEFTGAGWRVLKLDNRGEPGPDRWLADAGDPEAMAAAFDAIAASTSRFDALVYAAGVLCLEPAEDLTQEALARMMNANVWGFLDAVKRSLGLLSRAEPAGRIVAIGSGAARVGFPGLTSYAASKAALGAAVRTLAVELAPRGIRVNGIEPSLVDTPMLRGELAAREARGEGSAEELLHLFRQSQPLAHVTAPEEIARLALVLARGDFPSMTGAMIPCDCGLTIQ